jgi:hypothetical protein
MVKQTRTVQELSRLIMGEVERATECRGCTGVTLQQRAGDPNWYVSQVWNCTPMCENTILAIAWGFQSKFDVRLG